MRRRCFSALALSWALGAPIGRAGGGQLQIAGVRLSWDMGGTLYDLVRRTGWRRVR